MELIVIVEFYAMIYAALSENETSKIITGQKKQKIKKNGPKTKIKNQP